MGKTRGISVRWHNANMKMKWKKAHKSAKTTIHFFQRHELPKLFEGWTLWTIAHMLFVSLTFSFYSGFSICCSRQNGVQANTQTYPKLTGRSAGNRDAPQPVPVHSVDWLPQLRHQPRHLRPPPPGVQDRLHSLHQVILFLIKKNRRQRSSLLVGDIL